MHAHHITVHIHIWLDGQYIFVFILMKCIETQESNDAYATEHQPHLSTGWPNVHWHIVRVPSPRPGWIATGLFKEWRASPKGKCTIKYKLQ